MNRWFATRWLAVRCLLHMRLVVSRLRRKGLRATLSNHEHGMWFAEYEPEASNGWKHSIAHEHVGLAPSAGANPLPAEVRWLGAVCKRVAPLAKATCLPRSIVLARLMAQHGFRPSLRIGVARINGQVVAHAWIEHEGKPVGEDIEHYVAFPAGAFRGALESLGTQP
jgi:hypothetical protein